MGRIARLWGKSPSEYAGLEPGSLEAYLIDAGIGLRIALEDRKARAEQQLAEKHPSSLPPMRTDFDPTGV